MTTASDIRGRREAWKKELRALKNRLFIFNLGGCIFILFFGIYALFALTAWIEKKPMNEWSSTATGLSSMGVAVILLVAIVAPMLLTGGLGDRIQRLRQKAVALGEVEIGTLPGRVLLLWHHYGCVELKTELTAPESVPTFLAELHDAGYVVVCHEIGDEYGNVLTFLQRWGKDNPTRKQLASSLNDFPAVVSEHARYELYSAEFE